MRTLLIALYEMGRQPFGLASPVAWLREAGVEVTCLDVSRQPFREELIRGDSVSSSSYDTVAFHLPMHTATRLALPVIAKVRALSPDATLCCYGLYAPLNEQVLRRHGVDHILGGEFEADLVRIATGQRPTVGTVANDGRLPRLQFRVPERDGLPPPSRYAMLRWGSDRRVAGYTEASRGCKHHCRHCPVVPVYNGQFRVVPVEVVLSDVRQQVEAGVQHISFGDPDFFNGIGHAMRVADGMAGEFPRVTFDVTIKVEHLLRHHDHLRRLRESGCLFVTTAVESFDDSVLAKLQKGHTNGDVGRAVDACAIAGLTLTPTFVAFTPWTTLQTYRLFLERIDHLGLVDHVAPIQLAIRLLIPMGSRVLELEDVMSVTSPFDASQLVYPWRHPDPRVDALCDVVGSLVGRSLDAGRRAVFEQVWVLAHESLGQPATALTAPPSRVEIPFLNEPWYC